MSKLPLDLKKFQKIRADDNTSTLMHPDGHEIRIAHKKLSPKLMEQLEKLPMQRTQRFADGGSPYGPDYPAQALQDEPKQSGGGMASIAKLAPLMALNQGGQVQRYAEGEDEVLPTEDPNAQPMDYQEYLRSQGKLFSPSETKEAPTEEQAVRDVGAPTPVDNQYVAEDTYPATEKEEAPKSKNGQSWRPPMTWRPPIAGNQMPPDDGRSPAMAPAMPNPIPNAATPAGDIAPGGSNTGLAPAGPAQGVKPPVNPDPFGQLANIQQQIGGVGKIAGGKIEAERAADVQAQQQLGQEQTYQGKQNLAFDAFEKAQRDAFAARDEIMKGVQDAEINPRRYVEKMSTGSKIINSIALVLGGLGAGAAGKANPVSEYLDRQIDRDIEQQKFEFGKKNTLLQYNMMKYENAADALKITKIQSNDILLSRLREISAGTQDLRSRAAIDQIIGQKEIETSQLMQQWTQMKMQQALFSGAPMGPYASMAVEQLDPDKRERAVALPTGGLRIAYTKEGANMVREQLQTIQPIFAQLDKLGALGPSAMVKGTPANDAATAMISQLVPMINENSGIKRLSEEDINNIKHMLTDPRKVNSLWSNRGTETLKNFLQDKLLNLMSNQLEGGMGQVQQQRGPIKSFKPAKR